MQAEVKEALSSQKEELATAAQNAHVQNERSSREFQSHVQAVISRELLEKQELSAAARSATVRLEQVSADKKGLETKLEEKTRHCMEALQMQTRLEQTMRQTEAERQSLFNESVMLKRLLAEADDRLRREHDLRKAAQQQCNNRDYREMQSREMNTPCGSWGPLETHGQQTERKSQVSV